jgi:hypothetical protein
MQPKRTTPRRRRGLRVVGPGFYLWDPDVREALRLAAELSLRPVPLTRPRVATSACSRGPRHLPEAST